MLGRTLLNRILFKLGQEFILISLLKVILKGSRILFILFCFSAGDESFLLGFLKITLHSTTEVPELLPPHSSNYKL